jgi:hypothetical protein
MSKNDDITTTTNNFAEEDEEVRTIDDETWNTSGYSQQKKPPPKTSETVGVLQMNRSTSMLSNVAQLPICACRDRCHFPELPRATGHHCPGCKLAIHAVCGIHDDKAGIEDSNWCYDCWDSKMQPKKQPRNTSKTVGLPVQKKRATTSQSSLGPVV